MREIRFDPARRFDEVDRVVAMFLQAGGNSENVRIENDVAWGKACLLRQ